MRIVWDEPKRLANLKKHRLDFADLTLEFLAGAILLPAHSGRIRAIGLLDDEAVIAVVIRPLGSEAVSVISMRPASKAERSRFDG